MWPRQINRLPGKNVNGTCVISRKCVMRKVQVEVGGRYAIQVASSVQISIDAQRCNLLAAIDDCRAESIAVLNWNAEPPHERARVTPKALLPRDQWIAMMRVLELPLSQVIRRAHVVMRTDNKTRSVAGQKLRACGDFFRSSRLLSGQVVQAENGKRPCPTKRVRRSEGGSRPGRHAGKRRPAAQSPR